MQFGGYIFRLSESQAAYLLSFASAVDAVRFCHSAQALLMYTPWESAAAGGDCADCCGRTGGGWNEAGWSVGGGDCVALQHIDALAVS